MFYCLYPATCTIKTHLKISVEFSVSALETMYDFAQLAETICRGANIKHSVYF